MNLLLLITRYIVKLQLELRKMAQETTPLCNYHFKAFTTKSSQLFRVENIYLCM